METRLFEMTYELIATALSQLPSVFTAFSALPLMAQEIVMIFILAFGTGIIVSLVLGAIKFAHWWADRH